MISIKGSYVGNRQDGVEALDFFARGLIKAPFKLAPLKDLPKIFELMGMRILFHAIGYTSLLTQSRTRKNCRPLCPGNAGVDMRVCYTRVLVEPRMQVQVVAYCNVSRC